MLRVIKPKNQRVKRALDKRAPKLVENVKKAVLLQGTKSSAIVKNVLSDLHNLKKAGGCSVKLSKKNNNICPFEAGGETSLEFVSQKSDCSLFVFGSHSKKRPNNLVIGRMFDFHVLDMVEVGVEGYKSVLEMKGGGKYAPQVGSKPCFVFLGEAFEANPEMARMKSILLDFFRGEVVENINLAGIDRVFVCVAHDGKIYLRHCAVRLKKSGTKVPKVELVEAGPSLDLVVRRSRGPGEELWKESMRTVSVTKKKVKNVSADAVLGTVGRVYMPRQEVEKMALKKMKGLKRERRENVAQKREKLQQGSQEGGDASAARKKLRSDE